MRKFVTLLAQVLFAQFLLCPQISLSEPSEDEVETAARDFVELLDKSDYDTAFSQFDDTMKSVVPASKLAETWQRLQKQNGQFKKQLQARTEKQGDYDVVWVTCQFVKGLLDAKVVFDSEGRVAGLFFVPSQAGAGSSSVPPYANRSAFSEREIQVGNGEWKLPGTLSVPTAGQRPFPGVVLVQGSGPNDRDETIGPNKPFRDLAWGLASKGIAVVRYEKRTRQYGTKLVGKNITVKEESIDDALLAVAQLRTVDGIDPKRVFVLGHSLGGMLAPRIAKSDPGIAGLIILAGSTRPLEDIIVEQTSYVLSLDGNLSSEQQQQLVQVNSQAAAIKNLNITDQSKTNLLLSAPPKYWLDLREYDPAKTAKELKLPMLFLQGQRDYQVTMADFNGWKNALRGMPNATFKLYPKLNHLFMPGEGKSTPSEYEKPSNVDEAIIRDIVDWIRSKT
jgi:fermentation-respiration switch protein FrsA (DUF1100 family)